MIGQFRRWLVDACRGYDRDDLRSVEMKIATSRAVDGRRAIIVNRRERRAFQDRFEHRRDVDLYDAIAE